MLLLLLGVIGVIGIVKYQEESQNHARQVAFLEANEKYISNAQWELALWNVIETSGEQDDVFVKWWYNQEEDKYYLFVPRVLTETNLYWMYDNNAQVWIDGQVIENGSLYELGAGTYQVKMEQADASIECEMEVRVSSDIATLFLKTESGSLDYIHEAKENHEAGTYMLLDGNRDSRYTGTIENIHCRGNVSWSDADKKSYQIKLTEKKDFLGMGEDKHWILLANAFDLTLLRNKVALEIADAFELAYSPEAEFVDVYANGEFVGNYLLTEKIEIGENRVNITDLEEQMELMNTEKSLDEYEFFMEQQGRLYSTKGYRIENQPEDISGGYLLELEVSDRYGLEASGFITSRMQAVVFSSPKYASYEQVSYIANRYQDFEDAIFSESGYSPYTAAHFSEYIDMDSFARKYLLEEVVKNLDAAFTSQFFYKPDDSVSTKFFAGPAWDYDKAVAASGVTAEGIDLYDPQGFYAAVQTKDSDIWYALYNQEDFRTFAVQVYEEELLQKVRRIANEEITKYADGIIDSAINNAARWNKYTKEDTIEGKKNYFQEKVAVLSEFLNKRLDFLNQEWGVQE